MKMLEPLVGAAPKLGGIGFLKFTLCATALLLLSAISFATSATEEIVRKADPSSAHEDKRTPSQKLQGAYLAAWLKCVLVQKKFFLAAKAKERGVKLDSDFLKDGELSSCISSGLAEMKREYTTFRTTVKNEEGQKALTDYYVAGILHVKGASPFGGEDDPNYMKRMNDLKRKTDELWVRFEITQP